MHDLVIIVAESDSEVLHSEQTTSVRYGKFWAARQTFPHPRTEKEKECPLNVPKCLHPIFGQFAETDTVGKVNR